MSLMKAVIFALIMMITVPAVAQVWAPGNPICMPRPVPTSEGIVIVIICS